MCALHSTDYSQGLKTVCERYQIKQMDHNLENLIGTMAMIRLIFLAYACYYMNVIGKHLM